MSPQPPPTQRLSESLPAEIRAVFTANLAYKAVALFVTLILWFTIQGRKDTVATRDLRVEYIIPPNVVLVEPVPRLVKVRVAGPRPALKKFMLAEEAIILDLNGAEPGEQRLAIEENRITLPVGLKVLSMVPKVVRLRLKPAAQGPNGGAEREGNRSGKD